MPSDTFRLDAQLAREALSYATRGFLIFPLWHIIEGYGRPAAIRTMQCFCDAGPACGSPGKHPRTRSGLPNWGATSDERQIEAWWSMWPFANIGMPMGANGLAAIDIDPGHGGGDTIAVLDAYAADVGVDLRATRLIRTGGGGEHRIYRDPAGIVPTKRETFGADAPGVDTRGRGGYIVAPPSLHASGSRYRVIDNGYGIAAWPTCLTALLETAKPGPAPRPAAPAVDAGGTRAQRWAAAALQGEVDRLAAIPHAEGNGKHDALNLAAFKIGRLVAGGWLTEDDAYAALYNTAIAWPGHGEREIRTVILKAFADNASNPHPGPATRGGAS